MTTLILFISLISSLTLLLFGRFLGRGSIIISVTSILLNCIAAAAFTFSNVHNIVLSNLGTWFNSGLFKVDWSFAFDSLNTTMLLVVLIVSSIVHLYSTDYMAHDPHLTRFMSYLSLFSFFMIILVSGDNLIGLFLGWEGVGLCSYLLISFWFTRINAVKSATKAIIVNRVGDFGLTIGICLIFSIFQSVDFSVFLSCVPFYSEFTLAIGALLFIGAAAKSAQVILHTWLPDAMEGPTPVSALIHAATMVTAGVFLVIKSSTIFEYSPEILKAVAVGGAITCFFASTSGLVQFDLKKVIAYSTCSQLGYMFFACGLSGYNIGLFHLANHAFFKALLFLTAGVIIHSVSNEQDMRKFGGLLNILPLTYVILVIGSISLMGFPFMTGYYSKDLIIEYAYAKGSSAAVLGILTAGITSLYSMRLVFLTFLAVGTNLYRTALEKVHELSTRMFISVTPLIFGSIFLGYILKDLFVGPGTGYWNNSIFILPSNNALVEAEFAELYIKFAAFAISLFAIIPLISSYAFREIKSKFLTFKWFFDAIYNKLIAKPILKSGYNIFKVIDKQVLDPSPAAISINDIAKHTMQTGLVNRYGAYMVQAILIIIIIYSALNLGA